MRTTDRSQSLFDNSDREKHVIECPQPDQDMCTEFSGSQNSDYSWRPVRRL